MLRQHINRRGEADGVPSIHRVLGFCTNTLAPYGRQGVFLSICVPKIREISLALGILNGVTNMLWFPNLQARRTKVIPGCGHNHDTHWASTFRPQASSRVLFPQ